RGVPAPSRDGDDGADLREPVGWIESMSLLRHIRRCNEYRPERFLPLLHGDIRIGLVRRDNAESLGRFPKVFAVADDAVRLVAPGGFADLSAVVDGVVERLVADGLV